MARKFSLDALKQKFASEKQTTNYQGNNNYYPFWNMEANESATVRFLPDANQENPWFLLEKAHHELVINGEKKKVPCLRNYNEDCPICKASQAYYKSEGKETVLGKQLYKKRQYLGQVLVIEDPLPIDKETGKNYKGEIKLVSLGVKIYDAIKSAVEDGDLDEAPHSYEDGTNFTIKKSMNGPYADYSRSKFERKITPLDEETIELVEASLVDLNSLLPANPGADALTEMLEAFLNGGSYEESAPKPAQTPTYAEPAKEPTAPSVAPSAAKSEPEPAGDEEDEAQAVLAKLRARRANAG